jgi:hypothetical protein
MRLRSAIFAAATSAVLALAMGAPAHAAESPFPKGASLSPTVSTKTVVNDQCVAAVSAAIADGATDLSVDVCTRTVALSVAPARRVTANELASARGSLSAAEYAELSAAVNAGTVRSKAYRQEQINGADKESQYGTFYYDGAKVWISASYRGVKGSHKCVSDYAVGLDVSLVECADSGGTYDRTIYAKWRFSIIHKVVPINWVETYSLNVSAQGSIWQ